MANRAGSDQNQHRLYVLKSASFGNITQPSKFEKIKARLKQMLRVSKMKENFGLTLCVFPFRDVETDFLQKLIDTFSSVVDHLQFTSTCLEENKNKLILPAISLTDILLLLLHCLKFIPSQTSATVVMKLLTKLGYDSSLLTADKGHNLKENKLRKNRNDTTTTTTEQDAGTEERNISHNSKTVDTAEVELEERNASQESKAVDTDEAKLDKDAKSPEEENEDKSEACLQVVRKYVRKLMSIITSYKPEACDSGKHSAGILAVISWCLQQLDNLDDVTVINSFINWLKSVCERDSLDLVTKVIASKSDVAKDILERLLSMYPKVDSLTVTLGEQDEPQTKEELLVQLNTVLEQVAAVRTEYIKPKQLSNALTEEKSLALRKFFLHLDVKQGRTLGADGGTRVTLDKPVANPTQESEEEEIGSDDQSEIIEYQDFKVTPEIRRYFKNRKTNAQSKTAAASLKSPLKRNNDKELERSDIKKSPSKRNKDKELGSDSGKKKRRKESVGAKNKRKQ